MTQLDLTLLGGFSARLSPGDVVALPTRKTQALLTYLSLPIAQAHARDKLAALLWGDMAEAQARASLRMALFSIRAAPRSGAARPCAASRRGWPPSSGALCRLRRRRRRRCS